LKSCWKEIRAEKQSNYPVAGASDASGTGWNSRPKTIENAGFKLYIQKAHRDARRCYSEGANGRNDNG
jgi:hypothetical protein